MKALRSAASACVAAGIALAALAACDGAAPQFKSTDITGAPYGKALALTGHDGRAYTLRDFRGKVVVLFFGFTQCPDVCPTALAEVARAMKELGPQAERVQVLFVTLDPERDTREILSRYVPAFDPRFLGLYGDLAATRETAAEFKVFFEKRPGETPGSYSIDHSAQTYVFDTEGRLRLFVRHQRIASDLPHDVRLLLEQAS
ncbi:MAG: SCO family protein [Burkholderiales bacterium]|nr:SCO family protein [Burkholderiales bacterium]